jgi:hypothetical protein
MIVCPQCRHSNDEDAQFCSQCGRTLEPGPSSLAPVRRQAALPAGDDDLPPPISRKRWPVLTAIGTILVGALGFWAYSTFRPDPCDGRDFTSERYGYCLNVPEGWQAGAAQVGTFAADQISLPTESTTVLINAIDLPTDTELDEFVHVLRVRLQMQGVEPGPIRDDVIDGFPARSWDVEVVTAGEPLVARYVITLRDDVGWQISLSDTQERLIFHESAFRSMLSSWKFR